MKIVVTTECRAPPEIVFAANMDVPNWPRFIRAIKKIDVLSAGPIEVGMRFRATRAVRWHRFPNELKLAAMESPWRIVFSSETDGMRYFASSEIVPNGNGSRQTLTYQAVPRNFAARLRDLFSFLQAHGVRKRLQRDLADIAGEAERRLGA